MAYDEKAWRLANRERVLNYYSKYRELHPTAHNEWRARNRNKVNAARKRYYQRNSHAIKVARALGIPIPAARAIIQKIVLE